MQVRLIMSALAVFLFGAVLTSDARAYDYTAPVASHTTTAFDPAHGVVPFPNDLLFAGTTDLTLNIPVADPGDFSDPKAAMNTLDGFSPSAPWSMKFAAPIDAASLADPANVRLFEVTLSGPGAGVTGIVRELASPREFVVALAPSDTTNRTLVIVPTAPLKQMTSYMAVVTDGITDAAGQNVHPSLAYLLAERTSPLCVGGKSTLAALPDAQACALEPLRQLVNSQQAAAATVGVDPGSIVMSWVATTESITPTLQAIENVIAAAPPAITHLAPTGLTLHDISAALPAIADVYIGTIDLPYYLTAPSVPASGPADCTLSQVGPTPCPPLTSFWHAAPGAYVPPFDQYDLDPTSTNVTYANPLPVATSTQTVPLLLTVPNASSGLVKPAAGWPLVIFQHGITGNRTDMFAIAGTLAAQGFAVVAMDLPLHGVTDTSNLFYIGNTPFAAAGARERTFDIDLENNATGASGSDGKIDPSGSYFINLTSLLTSRDNLREGEVDLLTLSHAVQGMHVSSGADFDVSHMSFVGQSLGGIVGTVFLAVDPSVQVGVINVPGGGIARLLDASPAFGPRIHAGLAAAGIIQGTPEYDAFFVATQTIIDAGDPINLPLNAPLLGSKDLLLQEVVGGGDYLPDQVIPNSVPGAPLSGTEPLIAALGLTPITETTQDASGIRRVARFLQGEHGSLLDPANFPAVTQEMQGEAASMLASDGTYVKVADSGLLAAPPVGTCVTDVADVISRQPTAASAGPLPAKASAILDAAAGAAVANSGAPGAVVAVRTPQGTWIKAFGIANTATQAPMTTDVYQRIGSVTKTFVGTLLMQLVAENQVSLSDPISKYISGVPNGDDITLEELSNMTSGLANYSDNDDFWKAYLADPSTAFTPDQLLAVSFSMGSTPPPAPFDYSNANTILLGQVIQTVTGKPVADAFTSGIIAPLNLTATSFPSTPDIPDPHARGYALALDGSVTDATGWNPSWTWTAGEMISRVDDLLAYGRALGTGQGLLPAAAQTVRLNSFRAPGGYGIGLACRNGWVGHNGAMPGFASWLAYDTRSDTTVVVEANSDIASGGPSPSDKIMFAMAAALGNSFFTTGPDHDPDE